MKKTNKKQPTPLARGFSDVGHVLVWYSFLVVDALRTVVAPLGLLTDLAHCVSAVVSGRRLLRRCCSYRDARARRKCDTLNTQPLAPHRIIQFAGTPFGKHALRAPAGLMTSCETTRMTRITTQHSARTTRDVAVCWRLAFTSNVVAVSLHRMLLRIARASQRAQTRASRAAADDAIAQRNATTIFPEYMAITTITTTTKTMLD